MWSGSTFFAVLKLVILMLLLVGLSACDTDKAFVESEEPLPRTYYRVTADYKVKATGETVNFDYVVVCGGSVTNWSYTTPSIITTYHPNIMLMPTASGEVIGVKAPQMCSTRHWEDDSNFPIPADFMPVTLWYPNVSNLGFAFGYVSDLAYKSPYSKLEFLGSTLELSDKVAWQAWREDAERDYQQLGGLPGPWGYSGYTREKVLELNQGQDIAGYRSCGGVTRLNLPDEVREDVLAFVPEDAGRYWSSATVGSEGSKALFRALSYDRDKTPRDGIYNGGVFGDHTGYGYQAGDYGGARRSTGELKTGTIPYFSWTEGGALNTRSGFGNYYHDTFPVIYTRPLSAIAEEPERSLSDQYLQGIPRRDGGNFHGQQFRGIFESVILAKDDWNGFIFCGKAAVTEEGLVSYGLGGIEQLPLNYADGEKRSWLTGTQAQPGSRYAREYGEWGFRFKVNEQIVLQGDQVVLFSGRQSKILDRQGYVFLGCCYSE